MTTNKISTNGAPANPEPNSSAPVAHEGGSSTSVERRVVLGPAVVSVASALGLLVACGDDDDMTNDGESGGSGALGGRSGSGGTSGKAGTGGRSGNGGRSGSGSNDGGKSGSAGSGGKAGSAAMPGGNSGEGGEMPGAAGESGMGGEPSGGMGGAGEPEPDPAIASLNALLTAEYNAITAYTAGAGLIDDAGETDPLFALKDVIVAVAVNIQSQHRLHAESLVAAIQELAGLPVEEADVAAGFTPPPVLVQNPTISNVLKFAAGAERAAAIAYNQVLAGFEQAEHRFLATAIEGDETQHFIVLAALVLGLAAPGPNLDTDSADEVVPKAFVTTVGDVTGLNEAPPDYFP